MKVLVDGHRYELAHLEPTGHDEEVEILQFIHKEPVAPGSIDLKTVTNGTTNEEVIRVLIDRLQSQNKKFPCRENSIVVTKLEESLMWLEKRTADRLARKVEGKYTA